MNDPATRHRDAVKYNRDMAEVAEKLQEELSDPEVLKWVKGISRLHRYHERRHQESLRKLEEKMASEEQPTEKSIEEQQAEFAAAKEQKAEVGA